MADTPKVILFDIDGTLLKCNGAGKESLIQATKEIFNISGSMVEINFQGKTDLWILSQSLLNHGVTKKEIENNLQNLKNKYFSYLKINLKKSNPVLLEGVNDLLEILHNHEQIHLGLLTGNFKESAYIKTGHFNIDHYFQTGAFGDDNENRNNLPAVAKKRFENSINETLSFNDLYIIGDTIFDIECAKNANAKSVAVCTGWTAKDELQAENPDLLIENFSNIEKLYKFILHN